MKTQAWLSTLLVISMGAMAQSDLKDRSELSERLEQIEFGSVRPNVNLARQRVDVPDLDSSLEDESRPSESSIRREMKDQQQEEGGEKRDTGRLEMIEQVLPKQEKELETKAKESVPKEAQISIMEKGEVKPVVKKIEAKDPKPNFRFFAVNPNVPFVAPEVLATRVITKPPADRAMVKSTRYTPPSAQPTEVVEYEPTKE